MALSDEDAEEIGGWLDDLKSEILDAINTLRDDLIHELGLLEQRVDGLADDVAAIP